MLIRSTNVSTELSKLAISSAQPSLLLRARLLEQSLPVKTARKIPRVTRDHIALALVCLGLGAFGAGGTVAIDRLATETENSVDKQTLEESCEEFGNTLREGLREFFADELERAEHPDPRLIEQFGLTVQEAKELSAERIGQLKYNINVRFKDVPCGKVYDK